MKRYVDLHCHTTASDGTLAPAELIRAAKAGSLWAVAITDHDVLDGVKEAVDEGQRLGVTVIPGVEISLEYKGPADAGRAVWMHLLVYFPGLDGPLAVKLPTLQQWRMDRNMDIMRRLDELGMPVTMDELGAIAGGHIGRPHFAQAMTDRGYVSSMQQAFDDYLGKGKAAYVDKRRLSPEEAITMASGEGAVPVLAHPSTLGLDDCSLLDRLRAWKSFGLAGIEVDYPLHDTEYRRRLHAMADELDLLATGGTDFHGVNRPEVKLGQGIEGNTRVNAETAKALIALYGRPWQ